MSSIESYLPAFKEDLKKLTAIPSVNGTGDGSGRPLGAQLQKALECMVKIAENLGWHTYIDPEGYYAYAEVGKGPLIAVLGHMDVVPPGDLSKWVSDPYVLTERDGGLYGRGVMDDKGPTLMAMYGLKALLDEGKELHNRLRFVFLPDEEMLWRGVKVYNEKEEKAEFGFSPDSSFPVVAAEGGILHAILTAKNESPVRVKAGNAFNSVIPQVIIPFDQKIADELKKRSYKFEKDGNNLKIEGKSVHAMESEKGINAGYHYLEALNALGITTKSGQFYSKAVNGNVYAEPLFGKVEDDLSGRLRFNIGKIELTDESEKLYLDTRVPVTYPKEKITGKIKALAAELGFSYEEFDWLGPINVDRKSLIVTSLMKAYRDVTGDQTEPVTCGGATYARSMDNCVAFGPLFPGEEATEHQPNEVMMIDNLIKCLKIYKQGFDGML